MKNEIGNWDGAKAGLFRILAILVAVLSIFFALKSVNEYREGRIIGKDAVAVNMISVSGEGEVFAVPDIATFTFSVMEEAKNVPDAQKKATEKMNAVIAFLKGQKIDDKDVKTLSYDISPKYDYVTEKNCVQAWNCPGKQVLTGYQVSQTVSVKVRDIESAGDALSGIGSLSVSNLSGLTFEVDKRDDLQKQAQAEAIAKAKQNAEDLADALGVTLVRVVNFSEDGYNPMPFYAKMEAYDSMGRGGVASAAPAPEIPTGENKFTSNVSITYEIR